MSTPGNRRVTRNQDRIPHTHSCSFRRKQQRTASTNQRVRKSLKFDIDNETQFPHEADEEEAAVSMLSPTFNFDFLRNHETSTSQHPTTTDTTSHSHSFPQKPSVDEDRAAPPVENFWNIPVQPPPPSKSKNRTSHTLNRRSLRLRTSRFGIAQINESSPRRTEPTSDLVLRSKTTPVGCDPDQTSDYGTCSENSLYFRPSSQSAHSIASSSSSHQDRFYRLKHINNNKTSQSLSSEKSGSLSIGYNSDLDEVLSNLSIDDAVGNNNSKLQGSRRWDSDEEEEAEIQNQSEWESVTGESNDCHFSLEDVHLNNIRAYFKTHENISVLLPVDGFAIRGTTVVGVSLTNSVNQNRYHLRKRPSPLLEKLTIQTFDDVDLDLDFWSQGMRLFRVSPVICIQPDDIEFIPLLPATIQIPLKVLPGPEDEVHCLYNRCSFKDGDTDCSKIQWESVEAARFSINNGTVCFETFHFGLFVLVIRPAPISSVKSVRARVGGKLLIKEVPGIEVTFPEALEQDFIKAEAKVYFDTADSVAEFLQTRNDYLKNESEECSQQDAMQVEVDDHLINSDSILATPVLQLEPHGITFSTKPVLVTLPLPDYDEIVKLTNNSAQLAIWQSNTHSREPSSWERLEVDYEISQAKLNGRLVSVITFPVSHFSFFKVVWESIATCLHEAKVGMLYYFVSFAMKCQANMEEYDQISTPKSKSDEEDDTVEDQQKQTTGGARFGLGIHVFQADRPCPQMPTYKYKVGQSHPKLVKPGKLLVHLKSQFFIADVQAGEEEELLKEEADFRGRDFEKQFILKFKPGVKIERGPFGKVQVTRCISSRQNPQLIFEFNIQKHGNEADVVPTDYQSEIWSIVALRELATNLFVTDGDNWKQFAQEVGMTKQEIKEGNLKYDSDPFQKIVNHYRQRGGTPEELVNLLYRCNRAIKVKGNYSHQSPQGSNQTKSSNGSSGRGSLSSNNANFDRFGSHDSDTSGKTSGTRTSQDSGLPPRKRSHTTQLSHRGSGSGSLISNKLAKRRRLSDSLPGPSRRLESSDADEEASDSSLDKIPLPIAKSIVSEDDQNSHLNDRTPLTTQFLWKISDHMTASNWRALGRTLGLDEGVLINIDHNHGSNFRECSYQMLLAWKQRFPKKCNYGSLYKALMKEGMSETAKAMSDVDLDD